MTTELPEDSEFPWNDMINMTGGGEANRAIGICLSAIHEQLKVNAALMRQMLEEPEPEIQELKNWQGIPIRNWSAQCMSIVDIDHDGIIRCGKPEPHAVHWMGSNVYDHQFDGVVPPNLEEITSDDPIRWRG